MNRPSHSTFQVEPGLRTGWLDARPRKPARRSGSTCMVAMLLALMGLPSLAAQPLSGTLRVAGNPELAAVVARWSAGFRQLHPGARIETHLTGSDTGMAALYTGQKIGRAHV